MVIPTGEVRPRVRSPAVRVVHVKHQARPFGAMNYGVLFGYLAAMVGVGVYFSRKNVNTDDYFRGGMQMPWWAVGCSIYATMLSSLTFTGIPSKAFQQDWVLAVGNFMIPVVALVAVYVALPFYRRIDATSAYEYLQRRFNRAIRLFGSLSFTLFHVFRMGVVMSLTGLAHRCGDAHDPRAVGAADGSAVHCLLHARRHRGGHLDRHHPDGRTARRRCVAAYLLLAGIDGGFRGFLTTASAHGKFTWANYNWDITSTQIAIWIIVIGGVAQNVSSYTADQAVVQRYMTTATEQLAARSIWMNAMLSVPTTILFFGVGSASLCFYQSHPQKLDPTIVSDQIFPLFIAKEMPPGLAGLIVAGIFAAAQSTVSTSMNSCATTIVTDLIRPLGVSTSETAYLWMARCFTFAFGVCGTLLALLFVDPEIKSLFDTFIKVIGIFMGVLGGLFMLGALTRRANGAGAALGALVGAGTMYVLWRHTLVTFYLYTFCGISTCFVTGYLTSLCFPTPSQDLTGLTIYTLRDS